MFLKVILLYSLIFCTSVNAATFEEAKKIPHLRSFLANTVWLMDHIAQDIAISGCPGGDTQYVTATDQAPYREIGASDSYFSSALLKTNCDVQLTLNNPISVAPVPYFVNGKKIILKAETITIGANSYYYWECKTNIDVPQFQGENIIANSQSIISYFSDNVFVGNCVYVVTPF